MAGYSTDSERENPITSYLIGGIFQVYKTSESLHVADTACGTILSGIIRELIFFGYVSRRNYTLNIHFHWYQIIWNMINLVFNG